MSMFYTARHAAPKTSSPVTKRAGAGVLAATALGLEVREGMVTRGWGITGVADAAAVHDEDRQRERLQERVHLAVTTLGRRRARLADELSRASDLLARSSADLRA